MNRKLAIIPMIFTVLPLAGCGTLPKSISQEDWNSNRKYVELSTGMKMCYVEMGDPNGKPIILQHGMTDNSRSWSFAAPYFAEAGYHVYIPDLRGQGCSEEMDGHYTTFTYANDLNAFFEAKNIDKAICVGHSLGSFTMQTFWLMFPQRVEKAVLVSSAPLFGYQASRLQKVYDYVIAPMKDDDKISWDFLNNMWYVLEEGAKVEKDIEDVYKNQFLPRIKEEAHNLSKKSWTNIVLGLLDSNFCGDDKTENMYKYFDKTKDCLILHGNKDDMTAGVYQDELIGLLSNESGTNVTYREYDSVGHNIQFTIPHQCATDILGWLKDGVLPPLA